MSNQKELNKVDINVQFEESPTRINITSGEGIKTLFGKIRKYFSDLHSVAFSGSYEDLENKPTIPDISTKMDKDNPVGTGDLNIAGNGIFGGKVSVGTDITPTENNDLATKKYVDDNISVVNAKIGNLENLSTTDKSSIVNAINEIASNSGGVEGAIFSGSTYIGTSGMTTAITFPKKFKSIPTVMLSMYNPSLDTSSNYSPAVVLTQVTTENFSWQRKHFSRATMYWLAYSKDGVEE